MFCVVCFFGTLYSSFIEEDICKHDPDLVSYSIRQFGFENPLRVLLLGFSGRDEAKTWTKHKINRRQYRLKRNKNSKSAKIQYNGQMFSLRRIFKGRSAITKEFEEAIRFLARRQIQFNSKDEFYRHVSAHDLTVTHTDSQFLNMYHDCLLQTVYKVKFGDSLQKVSKIFYKRLCKYNLQDSLDKRTVNLMTYAYYVMSSFSYFK